MRTEARTVPCRSIEGYNSFSSDLPRHGNVRKAGVSAYDCYLRSLPYLQHPSKQGLEEAMPLLRHAIELDPEFASAYGLLAQWYAYRKGWGLVPNPDDEKAEVARLALIVLRIGQDDAAALSNTSWAVAYVLRDLPHAQSLVDRALAMNPNLAHACGNSGWFNLWSGNPAVAVEHLTRGMRHDPLHGHHHVSMRTGMAHALFFLDSMTRRWLGPKAFFGKIPMRIPACASSPPAPLLPT